MNKKIALALLLLSSSAVFANGGADTVSNSSSGAESASVSNANVGSVKAITGDSASSSVSKSTGGDAAAQSKNALSIDQSSHNSGNVGGTDVSRMVGGVVAPNLATTLTETCMGSTSVGAGWSGFGASFGTTWRDSSCTRRLDARQMSAFGDISTAREMMCESDTVRQAAKRVGRPCMEDNAGGVPFGAAAAVSAQTEVVPTTEAAAPVVTQQVKE